MSERKVVNKYYPPDFDPVKIPRRSKSQQIKVRMMLPMSIRCCTCGCYISKGTKYNSRQERVIGETYLGIPIHRSYYKCTNCSAEIVIKTDPRNSGYVVEAGGRRNLEHVVGDDEERHVGDDDMEIRRLASKRETETLSALDELKSLKSRHARVRVDSVLEALKQRSDRFQLEEEKQQLDMFRRSRLELHNISHKKWKPTYYDHLGVPKKSLVPKTEGKSNGVVLLCQQDESIDYEKD